MCKQPCHCHCRRVQETADVDDALSAENQEAVAADVIVAEMLPLRMKSLQMSQLLEK
jgi:hypothetical protein